MFRLGWSEILVIAVAALVFLKPEDLPKLMRKIGRLLGRIKEYTNSLSRDIERIGDDDPDDAGRNARDTTIVQGRRDDP